MKFFLIVALVGCGRIGFDADGVAPRAEFRSLCTFDKVTLIANGIPDDDDVAAKLGSALASGCGNAPVTRIVSQDDPGILDPDSDRPLLDADELGIIGGGDGPNRALAHLLREAATPLAWSGGNPTATIREGATDRVIAAGPITAHDFAIVMVIVEPVSGARVLSGQGLAREGTVASGLWFAETAPAIATNADVWTVVDWTDTDPVAGATTGDTYVILESGR